MRYLVIGIVLLFVFGCNEPIVDSKVEVKQDFYSSPIDPNDRIYKVLSIRKDWIDTFGDNERTIIFYNLSLHRVKINELEQKLLEMKKELNTMKDPNEATIGKVDTAKPD